MTKRSSNSHFRWTKKWGAAHSRTLNDPGPPAEALGVVFMGFCRHFESERDPPSSEVRENRYLSPFLLRLMSPWHRAKPVRKTSVLLTYRCRLIRSRKGRVSVCETPLNVKERVMFLYASNASLSPPGGTLSAPTINDRLHLISLVSRISQCQESPSRVFPSTVTPILMDGVLY
jgi:hypothetical protein